MSTETWLAHGYSYGEVRPIASSARFTATCSHQSRWKKSRSPSAMSIEPLTTWMMWYRSRSQRKVDIARARRVYGTACAM